MNKFILQKSILIIFICLLFSCSKSDDKQNIKTKVIITKRTTPKQTKNKNEKTIIAQKKKQPALSKFNEIERKTSKYNSYINDMSLSDSNMLERIKIAAEKGDIKEIDKFFRFLIGTQNYKLALHLATNALENTTAPSEKARYIGMTLQSFLGAENDDSNRHVADNAFQMMCDISNQLNKNEKLLAWDDAFDYYSTTCVVDFKNLDDAFSLLEIANKYIYPVDKKISKEMQDVICLEIGYRLAYSKKPEKYILSKNTIKLLRDYAHGLDDNLKPKGIELPDSVADEDRKLKPLLLKGINRYEKTKNNTADQ